MLKNNELFSALPAECVEQIARLAIRRSYPKGQLLFAQGDKGDAFYGLAPIRLFPAHTLSLLPAEWLRGKIIILGSDLPHQDQHRTPLSVLGDHHETMPGALIHAHMLAQMASGNRPFDRRRHAGLFRRTQGAAGSRASRGGLRSRY